jgi:hypothetical protein
MWVTRGNTHDLTAEALARFYAHELDDDLRHPDLDDRAYREKAVHATKQTPALVCEEQWRREEKKGNT